MNIKGLVLLASYHRVLFLFDLELTLSYSGSAVYGHRAKRVVYFSVLGVLLLERENADSGRAAERMYLAGDINA